MAKNFLLGRGENLTADFDYQAGGGTKKIPQTFDAAKSLLLPQVEKTAKAIKLLPDKACPNGDAVFEITLHPAFLARSHLPEQFLNAVGLELIGSRGRKRIPSVSDQEGKAPVEEECPELIVMGHRKTIESLSSFIRQISPDTDIANDFRKFDEVRAESGAEKVRRKPRSTGVSWEFVLHADSDGYVIQGLLDFVESLDRTDVSVVVQKRIYAGGLCFVPIRGNAADIEKVADYSFVRCARRTPELRATKMTFGGPATIDCDLPEGPPIDPSTKMLILDGGRPLSPWLDRYVRDFEAPGVGEPDPVLQQHCLGVISAALFGPIQKDEPLPRPVCQIDSVRIFDKNSARAVGDEDYYQVLTRVRSVLLERGPNYDFISLCSGPAYAIDDGEPSLWTSVIDQILARLRPLMFCAVGNDGELDRAARLDRIQPPSDCVNAMSIGAIAGKAKNWKRAAYSCTGPGRRPGYVKPDVMAFGGELPGEPFYALGPAEGTAIPLDGTSYATPSTMRIAGAVRASLGDQLSPLAIKALLINRSDPGKHARADVGWGRIIESPADLIHTDDNEAVIIYQGTLVPGQYRIAQIPLPEEELSGSVEITATFCFKTETDPHHPLNYTRAGLEVTFRPHSEIYTPDDNGKVPQRPDSASFFKARDMFQLESVLRRDAWKWESVMHKKKSPKGVGLHNPCFDIHYTAREESGRATDPENIPYALIVRVRSKSVRDLYNRIYRRFNGILIPLRPVLTIPIQATR